MTAAAALLVGAVLAVWGIAPHSFQKAFGVAERQQIVEAAQTSPQVEPGPSVTPPAEPVATPSVPEPSARMPWRDGSAPTSSSCQPPPDVNGKVSEHAALKARVAHEAGVRAFVRGDAEVCLKKLCEAAQANPGDSAVAFDLARALLMARDASAAARWARRAVDRGLDDRRTWDMLGDARAWQGDVEGAKAAWFKAHQVKRPTPEIERALYRSAMREAQAASKHADHPRTERLLRRAMVLDPRSVEAATQLAQVLMQQRHPAAASRWVGYALHLDSDDAGRQLLAGDICQELGDTSGAREHWQRALDLTPRSAAAHARLRSIPR